MVEDPLPEPISEAIGWADVVLFVVTSYETQVMGHHRLRREATARGARVGFLTGHLKDAKVDRVAEVWRRARELAAMLQQARDARLVSPAGTDLRLSLAGRRSMAVVGDLRLPGSWGAVPDYAEATISPVEGSVEGTIVADGMITGYGRLPGLLTLTVKEGRVAELAGEASAWLSERLRTDEGANLVAEMGLGANPFVAEITGEFEDKKIFGTAHIGLGDNRSFGGSNKSAIHLDVLISGISLFLDGERVIP
jgi:leucyl aminopeptidase (aminopeptidase T)